MGKSRRFSRDRFTSRERRQRPRQESSDRRLVTDGGTDLVETPAFCPACGCDVFLNGKCKRCGRPVREDDADGQLISDGGTRGPSWGSSKVGGLVASRVGPLDTEWEFDVEYRKHPEARHVLDLPREDVGDDEDPRYLVEVQVGTRYPASGDGQARKALRAAYADPALEDVVVRHPLAVTDPEADLGVRPVDDGELPAVIGAEPGSGGTVHDVERRREWVRTLRRTHDVTPATGNGATFDGVEFARASERRNER